MKPPPPLPRLEPTPRPQSSAELRKQEIVDTLDSIRTPLETIVSLIGTSHTAVQETNRLQRITLWCFALGALTLTTCSVTLGSIFVHYASSHRSDTEAMIERLELVEERLDHRLAQKTDAIDERLKQVQQMDPSIEIRKGAYGRAEVVIRPQDAGADAAVTIPVYR